MIEDIFGDKSFASTSVGFFMSSSDVDDDTLLSNFDPSKIFGAGPITLSCDMYLGCEKDAANNIDMFINGSGFTLDNTLNLYLFNDTITNSVDFFIKGDGIESGAFPLNNSIEMFLGRDTAESLPLYLFGTELSSISGFFDIVSSGVGISTVSVDMVMPNIVGSDFGSLILYTHGF